MVEEQIFNRVRSSLQIRPDHPRLWAQLLHLHWVADQPFEGLQVWLELLQYLPEEQRPHLTYGNILRDLNRFEAADASYARACGLAEGSAQHGAAWNHSQLLIGLQNYSQAYALAEERLLLDSSYPWRPGPWWQGLAPADAAAADPLAWASTVTVWAEQGIGDVLQYLRWLPLLIRRGCSVRLEVEPPLLPLLRQGLSWLGPGLSVSPMGLEPRPLASPCQGSLLSLPWLLGGAPLAQAFQSDPAGSSAQVLGYLRSNNWPSPAVTKQRPPRIGLVWAAGRKHDNDFIQREYERRSLPPPILVRLLEGLERCGAELVCLQYGLDRQRAAGWGGSFAATLADGISLADTARWISALDLVITVDTATAHLVGAMAKPGWVLLPWGSDPRWLRDRTDSPWYPSLTLLRQPRHRDWDGLVPLVLQQFQLWRAREFPGGSAALSP